MFFSCCGLPPPELVLGRAVHAWRCIEFHSLSCPVQGVYLVEREIKKAISAKKGRPAQTGQVFRLLWSCDISAKVQEFLERSPWSKEALRFTDATTLKLGEQRELNSNRTKRIPKGKQGGFYGVSRSSLVLPACPAVQACHRIYEQIREFWICCLWRATLI